MSIETKLGRKVPQGNAVRRGTQDAWATGVGPVGEVPVLTLVSDPPAQPEPPAPPTPPADPKPVQIGTAESLGPLGDEVRAANAELKAIAKRVADSTVSEVKQAIANGELDLEVVVQVEAAGRKRLGLLNLLAPEND